MPTSKLSMLALKPAAQRFAPFSGAGTSPANKLNSIMPTPAKPAALTPARPEQPTMPTPNTAEHAAAEKKDCPTLTSRTLAPPNTSSKAQTGARARDAKSMPMATGRWTAEEHDEFLKCLDIYGREWKKVAERITTRTAAQIRSHAQKYFKKIEAAGEGAPRAAKPAQQPAAADGAPQIPAETRPRAASEGLVIPQAKRSRANSDDRAPGLRRRVTCDDLRALEALELLREAAGGAF